MEAFVRETGIAAPLLRANVDTDQIIPVREMVDVITDDYGAGLFANWRYRSGRDPNPEFILNRAPWNRASILVSGRNFGCGSSRELAPRALRDFGIRAVIAPSFSPIFFNNCFRNGIIPVELPEETVKRLADQAAAAGGGEIVTVDLERQEVISATGEHSSFRSPALLRQMLLAGVDEIGLTLQRGAEIEAYQARDRGRRPWVYGIVGPKQGSPAA